MKRSNLFDFNRLAAAGIYKRTEGGSHVASVSRDDFFKVNGVIASNELQRERFDRVHIVYMADSVSDARLEFDPSNRTYTVMCFGANRTHEINHGTPILRNDGEVYTVGSEMHSLHIQSEPSICMCESFIFIFEAPTVAV